MNAYGAAVGWATVKDGQLLVPEANISLGLKAGVLTGSLLLADLTFSARRTADPLPVEPEPPAVGAGPKPAWTYHAGAALWAGPVVADGVAYLGDAAGVFHAVDVATGRARWTFAAGAPLFGAPAVAGAAICFVSDQGRLHYLTRADGRELWHANIGGSGIRSVPSRGGTEWDFTAATPVVAADMIFVGSADGTFQARSAANGNPLWSFKTGGKIRAAALVNGNRVVVGSTDHFVYALDRRTGALLWRFDAGSPVTTAPMLAGDRLVIGTRDQGLLYALDAATGTRQWTVDYWLSWVESTPVLVDGMLYVGSSDSRRVRVIEPGTGRVRWTAQVWGWTWGTPLVVGDTVYYGTAGAPEYFITQRASLGALYRRTGALKWRQPLPLLEKSYVAGIAGSLAYFDGKILAATLAGTLEAYDVGPPAAGSPAPLAVTPP